MNPILTFIIPSYNVERYLPRCLDSFLCPSVQDRLEVIVVDDGSCDGTADVACSYARRFPGVYRVIRKENGGHGSVINVGSREARGKFFKVVDADDWVVTENLPDFIRYLSACGADAVLTPFHTVDMATGARTLMRMYAADYGRSYTPDELAADWKSFDRCAAFHGITYRTAFYNGHRHELPEKVFYEDQEYAAIPICEAGSVAVLDLAVYQYQIGDSAQSVSHQNQVARIGHLEAVILHMLGYWQEGHGGPGFSEMYWMRKAAGTVLSYYEIMCLMNPDRPMGRAGCAKLNAALGRRCPELYRKVRGRYHAYVLLSRLHIGLGMYEGIRRSSLFRLLRRNHKTEKE